MNNNTAFELEAHKLMLNAMQGINACNTNFQPWTFADAFEAALERVYAQLRAKYTTMPLLQRVSGGEKVDERISETIYL